MSAATTKTKTTKNPKRRLRLRGLKLDARRVEWAREELEREVREVWHCAAVAMLGAGVESGIAVARANHVTDAFAERFAPGKVPAPAADVGRRVASPDGFLDDVPAGGA